MNSETIVIEYGSSIHVPAGWRSIWIRARAKRTSPKMAQVVEVLEIDGEEPVGSLSRTGANRQRYSANVVIEREVGARKRLGSCIVFDDED